MYNIWIIWLGISFFIVSAIGLHKKFVTTKISGKIVVVDRISFKAVKWTIVLFTIAFALFFGVDSFLLATRFTVTSLFYNILYWIWWGCISTIVVIVYNVCLRFIYNKGREENEKDVREELRWRNMLKVK